MDNRVDSRPASADVATKKPQEKVGDFKLGPLIVTSTPALGPPESGGSAPLLPDHVVPELNQVVAPHPGTSEAENLPAVALDPAELSTASAYVLTKRLLDLIACSVMLLIGLPLLLLISLAIKLTSPGPVLYRTTAVGKNGAPFQIFKFRTMTDVLDSATHEQWLEKFVRNDEPFATDENGKQVYKVLDDPRVTTLGKWLRKLSLNEIPQMLNVLRGDMSLVGPRPPLPFEYQLYDPVARQRLLVPPGITGLYQVTARSQVGFSGMLAIDFDYIRRRSIWLDLWIMIRTPWVMLTGRGGG